MDDNEVKQRITDEEPVRDMAEDRESSSESGEEDVSGRYEEASQERSFTDGFIRYSQAVELPSVKIDSPDCFHQINHGLAEIKVVNCSNFSYSVAISRAPDWVVFAERCETLQPGEEASFSIGIDQSKLPPGNVRGIGQILLRRPFISRSYSFEVNMSVDYVLPVPSVEVMAIDRRKGKALRITVRNAGGGLLQGYYYDRASNDTRGFLLSAEVPVESQGVGSLPEMLTRSDSFFQIEKNFFDFDDVRGGILLACDCINPHFRRFEIVPHDYFERERFASPPFIDFMEVEPGRTHEFTVSVHNWAFRNTRSIVIPDRLKKHLESVFGPDGKVRFTLSGDANQIGCVIDHIEFDAKAATKHRMPILISFRKPATKIALPEKT